MLHFPALQINNFSFHFQPKGKEELKEKSCSPLDENRENSSNGIEQSENGFGRGSQGSPSGETESPLKGPKDEGMGPPPLDGPFHGQVGI